MSPFPFLYHWLQGNADGLLDEWPIDRPADWVDWVNAAVAESELSRIRASVTRRRPFGPAEWVDRTARELNLDATLRPRGRPSKKGTPKIIRDNSLAPENGATDNPPYDGENA